ncbi:MAG: hypothetical protein WC732_08635 [Candidatus Omnitrophota bacterium]
MLGWIVTIVAIFVTVAMVEFAIYAAIDMDAADAQIPENTIVDRRYLVWVTAASLAMRRMTWIPAISITAISSFWLIIASGRSSIPGMTRASIALVIAMAVGSFCWASCAVWCTSGQPQLEVAERLLGLTTEHLFQAADAACIRCGTVGLVSFAVTAVAVLMCTFCCICPPRRPGRHAHATDDVADDDDDVEYCCMWDTMALCV